MVVIAILKKLFYDKLCKFQLGERIVASGSPVFHCAASLSTIIIKQ